jgi:hypothetical protein
MEGLGQLQNPMTSSGIEPTAFLLVLFTLYLMELIAAQTL